MCGSRTAMRDPVGPEAGETVAAPHGIPTLTQHRVDAGTDPDEDEGRRARHRVEAQGLQSAHEMTSPPGSLARQPRLFRAGRGGADGDAGPGGQRGHRPVRLLLGEQGEEGGSPTT